MAFLLTSGKFQAFDSAGDPLSGGKVYTYAAGGTTPLASYTTQAGTVANANPVILDSAGRASIWLADAAYRIVVKSSADVTQTDTDNISLGSDSTADYSILRANRLIVGYDDDSDITNNASALANNSLLVRYSTSYAEAGTENGVSVQRYIESATPSRGSCFKGSVVLGASSDSDTPAAGSYPPEWGVNIEIDNYSTNTADGGTVGGSFVVRRYDAQQVQAIQCNAMDMRVPATSNDTSMGGITGMEAHSDAIGPDRATGNNGYGYRQTIRCTARTQETAPTWTKRGTAPFGNNTAVALRAICLPKNATVTTNYTGAYFVCTTAGTTDAADDTLLNGTTTPGATVTDGTVVWECRRGTEVGIGLIVRNGDTGTNEHPGYYRYGIIIDDASRESNPNTISRAMYVYNSGEMNYGSEGSPSYHAWFNDLTGEVTIYLGTEMSGLNQTIGEFVYKGRNASAALKTYANISASIADNTAGSEDGRITMTSTFNGTGEVHATFEGMNTVIGKKAVLNVAAQEGFLHIPGCDGPPVGTPTLYTGKQPVVYDRTNRVLYIYAGGAWRAH